MAAVMEKQWIKICQLFCPNKELEDGALTSLIEKNVLSNREEHITNEHIQYGPLPLSIQCPNSYRGIHYDGSYE